MKRKLKKLTALLLSILMVTSMFTEFLPLAYAAEGGVSAPEAQADTPPNMDFGSPDTGRPGLFVDFLGDNKNYRATLGEAPDAAGLCTPGDEDQNKNTNPATTNTWVGYQPGDVQADTIFWVGVGIDRMNVLDLFKQSDNGIYSLELGFYYNDTYIEPYTGANGDYKAVIKDANITNYNHNWGAEYEIIAAETGLPPQRDQVTEETLKDPSMSSIINGDGGSASTWKMTYVSLGKVDGSPATNRFAGIYDGKFHPVATPEGQPTDSTPNLPTKYLLLIPFVLKTHDAQERLCLRMVRNAGHFSIGGNVDGAETYGAWERVTVRNPQRELKLMANFQGDLNIFTGTRVRDISLNADLIVEQAGGSGNTAVLSITDDPSPNPVKATGGLNDKTITGLTSGVGMTLDVTCATGYDVTVSVTLQDGTTKHDFITVKDKVKYTFIMPEDSVIVTVKFNLNNATEFWAYLREDHSGEDPADKDPGAPGVQGNATTITIIDPARLVVDKDTFDPDAPVSTYPSGKAAEFVDITINTALHSDYYAVVELYNLATGNNMPPKTKDPGDLAVNTTTSAVTIPAGGTLTLNMPKSDVEVRVTYLPATRHKAELTVYHDGAAVLARNVAQLATPVYSDADTAMSGYSGVVYHEYDAGTNPVTNRHNAVENTFRILPRVDASTAAVSGSLGGDGGKTAASWAGNVSGFMALAYAAKSATDFRGKLSPYDLKQVDTRSTTVPDGLRKNAKGDFYADSDIGAFYDRLWELALLAGMDIATYKKDVLDTTGSDPTKVLYSYYDLTPAQVQMYLLDYEAYADKLAAGDTTAIVPGLRAAAGAAAALGSHTWFVPSTSTKPPTAPDLGATPQRDSYLEIRAGRQVELVLEADSAYTVKSIVLHDPAGTNADVPVTVHSADYQNVYPFTMPDYACEVRVTYALRDTKAVNLSISGQDGKTANGASLSAYTPEDPATPGTAAKLETITASPSSISNVFVGSVVTVKVNKYTGYKVSATVKKTADNSPVPTTPTTTTDMKDGTIFTFTMPSGDVNVSVDYTKENVPSHKATVKVEDEDGGGSFGYWQSNHLTILPSVDQGTRLTAEITVRPGYYIHAVEAYSDIGSYPFTISGNGWNNKAGGVVTVDTVMPGVDLTVRVVVREGPPPAEPALPLTIRVDDPENVGAGSPLVYIDNWAKATVVRDGTTVTLGPVGKGTTGNAALSAVEYATAGEEVTVEFQPYIDAADKTKSYHVKSVEILPASLGATVEWLSPTKAKFIMPAGSATAVVTFAKGSAPTWFMELDKTEWDGAASVVIADNTVPSFTSPTITKVPGMTEYTVPQPLPQRVPVNLSVGAAAAGEKVTLNIDVVKDWYVHSLTVTADGTRLPYELPNQGYSDTAAVTRVQGSFVMPNGDVSVTVNYRKGPIPTVKDYQVELAVTDPDNVNDGTAGWALADNYASAAITGATSGAIAPVGLAKGAARGTAYAKPGDMVTITYAADTGFALDIIIVTPSGLRIVPTYLGNGRASFTMPAESVTAEVRFKKGTAAQYSANLILRAPTGVEMAKAGRGSFGTDHTANIYSLLAAAGDGIDVALFAKDGYYIKEITVTPAALGVNAGLTGSFGKQSGSFVMPAANVTVNVWFEKAWPDQVKYGLTLKVYDGDRSGSTANFGSVGGTALTPPDSDTVSGGERKTLAAAAKDRESVFVAISPVAGYYPSEITATDARGKNVAWAYAPGGIQLTMPPSHVTIAVRFAEGAAAKHTAKLHMTVMGGAAGTATLSSDSTNTVTVSSTGVQALPNQISSGTTMTVSSTRTNGIITAAVAVSASGKQLIVPMTQVTAGGTSTFAMPDEDADVYLVLDDGRAPGADDKTATLVVSGPTGSGSAVMATGTPTITSTTGTVNVGAGGVMFAPIDGLITVDIATDPANSNIQLASVRVTAGNGAAVPYTWTDATQRKFTYKMPVSGAAVYVELEDVSSITADFTAQVVVNDSEYTDIGRASRNTALLRKDGAAAPGAGLLTPLKAGDKVWLDLTVQPGFEIKEIIVVPARYGIAPSLTLKPKQDQNVSFLMPSDDVVVYARFGSDGKLRQDVTLYVSGTPGVTDNKGYITSDFSGKKGPVISGGKTQTVKAYWSRLPDEVEWVTVDYQWDVGSSVESLTVTDSVGNNVPFTQVNPNQIKFPVVNSAVDVRIKYRADPNPPKFDAVLHVIDLDSAGAANTAKLTWNTDTTGDIGARTAPGGTATLRVPAGETVTLDALAQPGVYIKAAYVLYEDGGQMIECNLTPDVPGPGYTGSKSTTFEMHPGINDVYVYYTTTPPTVTEYAAVLMLDGLAADTKSEAVMTHSGGADAVTVKVNGAHGYVTEKEGGTITVTVLPDVGYTIDYILMTPLGIPIVPRQIGNTFTFTMPAQNAAARVVLKESGTTEYSATLHYRMADGTPVPDAAKDWASLSYTGDDGNAVTWNVDGEKKVVPEAAEVTLGVAMDGSNFVLAAYVLKGGVLVPLDKALEGASDTGGNNTALDDQAKFIMPGADVEVYVWYTATPQTGTWRTAVLTVTDENDKGQVNLGLNSAEIKTSINNTNPTKVESFGVLKHAYLTVAEGETVTVTVAPPADKYEFQRPATISHSLAGTTLGLTESGSAPSYSYTYNVGAFNSAVAVHYKSAAVAQNGLTVLAVDNDNPGDGTVRNNVTASPAGMTALSLDSTTSAGARQVIPGVAENTQVSFTVTPAPGYLPVATLVNGAGATATTKKLALTDQGNGTYTGTAFSMPGKSATLIVQFYQSRSAILQLVNTANAGDQSSQAQMTEDAFGGSTVAHFERDGLLANLPGGTQLAASMMFQGIDTKLLGAVLLERGNATLISPTPVAGKPNEYRHTLSQNDVTIQMVVTDKNNTDGYLAAVTAMKLPTGCTAPTIATDPANPTAGNGWTLAKENDTVNVHVTVPANYRADLVADNGANLSAASLTADGDVTFYMPAANVQVTVTYTKVKFDATLEVREAASVSSATLESSGISVNAGDTLRGLKENDILNYTAALADAGTTELAGVLVTPANGGAYFIQPENLSGTVTMPADDVTVTIITAPMPTDPTTPTDRLYIATVTTAGTTDALPGNAAQSIVNTATTTLPKGNLWAGAYESHLMLVTFTTEPGYTAVVTAKTAGGAVVSVLQQDTTGACTAYVTMPSDDVIVTVTYYKGAAPTTEHDLTLKLVGHGKEADNKAELDYGGSAPLTAKGTEAPTADVPVSKTVSAAAKLGVNLDLSADRKSDYTIVKATLEVDGVETELSLNRYGTNATSLFFMPDADATVTVYYSKIYTSTLQSVGAAGADTSSMSTPGFPTVTDNGKLDKLLGGETITATATADTGANRSVVGVLYTTNSTGAQSVPDTDTFTMPHEDVTVTAVFQGPDTDYHLAKVALDADSAPGGGSVSIANKTDAAAPRGPFWTAAEENDTVTVGITLAAGYQAVITKAVRDDDGTQIYVNRTTFTATTANKTASFTMPDADATVTVKFIKGYTADLVITDVSAIAGSTATITAGGTTITGTSDGANVTYTDDKSPLNATGKIAELADGTQVDYTATPAAGVVAKVVKTTAATGSSPLTAPGNFAVDGEDVTVGVILQDVNDPNQQLAKVVLLGESDIVGNGDGAKIADLTGVPVTTAGNIWTTTKSGNTVTVSLTVAKGFVVEVTATQDDTPRTPITDLSKDGGTTKETLVGLGFLKGSDPALGDYISDAQNVTFTMPAGSTEDVTVYVKYIYAGKIPAPYDPENDINIDPNLAKGYIYGENRGSHAVITIPTLADATGELYHADQYDKVTPDPATKVTFRFFLKNLTTGVYTELEQGGQNPHVELLPYDPDALVKPTDPYNYGNYYTKPADGTNPEVPYTGAKFILKPTGTSQLAKDLAAILDNDGSVDTLSKNTVLYVMAEDAGAKVSDYVEVLVNPYYQLKGTFISYAPTHEATAALYALGDNVDPTTADLMDYTNYASTVFAVDKVAEESGSGLWKQEFSIKSSELLGGTYMLSLKKTSHITYTRVNIALDTTAAEYDANTKAFTIADEITLIPGNTVVSVVGDGELPDDRINLRDRDLVMDHLAGGARGSWSEETDETKTADWAISIYNPETVAYRCDLNGDGKITVIDRDIVMDYLNRSADSYLLADGKLPRGLNLATTIELLELEQQEIENLPETPTELPEEPVDPDMTVDPEAPAEPEVPVEPDVPSEPEKPVDPALPVEPAQPDVVAPKPEDPEKPALPPEPPAAGGGDPPPAEEERGEPSGSIEQQ